MAKDYFQDIVPPHGDPRAKKPRPGVHKVPVREAEYAREDTVDENMQDDDLDMRDERQPVRSIRNISMPPRSSERSRSAETFEGTRISSIRSNPTARPRTRMKRAWIWVLAAIAVLVVLGLGLFVFRPTTVMIVPHSQVVTFDQSAQFTAYPSGSAPTTTLSYMVSNTDLEESQVVASTGVQQVQEKASGEVTVYNGYSTDSVRLVKNTRFQTPDGLIFRAPADILVPGKSGTTPGHIDVTVIADKEGTQYNVSPPTKFTLPGLKSTPAMYSGVYAQSNVAMTGGYSGPRPVVVASVQQDALSSMRDRMQSKIQDMVATYTGATTTALADLVQITYQDLPPTDEGSGQVRLHEIAHVEVPVFPVDLFASTIAQMVAANVDQSAVVLLPGKDFSAQYVNATSTALGTDPIAFSLSGTATLVWKVDTQALASALAGRDQGAFQTIITGFPGIQEAHARIEPFWKRSFPTDPANIKIQITDINASQ